MCRMFDTLIIFFFFNLLLLTLLFWIIMICGEALLTKNISNDNLEVFECGFLNINLLKIKPNFFFLIFAILLIIYDIEFFLFIPLFFNFNVLLWQHYWIIAALYVLLIISFIFDWQNISLNWFI